MTGIVNNRENDPGARPNTLNADQRTLVALAQKFDADSKVPPNVKREFVRWPFRRATMHVMIRQDRNNSLPLKLACRNLSRGGMALLHAAYVHQGTKITVAIPAINGDTVQVDGVVVRCVHRGGVVHEIGVKFDAEIDIRRFATPAQTGNGFSLERVDGATLSGRVLLASEAQSDITLFQHYLSGTGAHSVPVVGGEAALEAIHREAFDVIVCDEGVVCPRAGDASASRHGPDRPLIGLAHAARAEGCTAPIILLALSKQTDKIRELQKLPGVLVVLKPLTQAQFLIALGEFLKGTTSNFSSTFRSTIPPSDPASALVLPYVRELHELATKLEQGLQTDDAEACTKVCHRIQGSAPTMGFTILGELAEKAAKTISISKSLAESHRTVKELITACERARAAA